MARDDEPSSLRKISVTRVLWREGTEKVSSRDRNSETSSYRARSESVGVKGTVVVRRSV